MLPIFMQTNMVPLPLWIVLISTTLFFVLVPGRMVPAMAIVTSAAQPRLRGTFMSMNGAIQSLASGLASFIGGTMISVSATGVVVGYDHVGYLAMLVTLAGIAFAGSIQMLTGKKTDMQAGSQARTETKKAR
jgi:predicted MFS family arabinose efflux permease